MKRIVGRTCALAVLLLLIAGNQASAQTTPGSLKLPVSVAVQGGTFSGTVAVTRFEARGDRIVAIAFVSGTLTQGRRTIGTAVVGEVVVPVTFGSGGIAAVSGRSAMEPKLRRVTYSIGDQRPNLKLVQAEGCPVVNMALGPFAVNVLGVDVQIPPLELHLNAQPGTPLGELVCQVSELIENVAGLVGVVNGILNLLILLLGGLTGGLGAIPGA